MKTGIYKIVNKVNSKLYIGYATDIIARWYGHKSKLRRNIHPNKYLQYAWNKYKEDNFEFSIIEECNRKDLCKKEDYYVKLINPLDRMLGYNIEPTNPNHPIRKPSIEEINAFVKRNSVLIKCKKCGKECNLGNHYRSHGDNCGKKRIYSEEFRKKTGDRARGRIVSPESREKARRSSTGRKCSPEHILKMVANKTKFKHSEKTRLQMSNSKGVKVYQYNLDGVIIRKFKSIMTAYIETGISASTIHKQCNGSTKYNSASLCRWSYKELSEREMKVPYRVQMIDINTNETLKLFRTVHEAGLYLKKLPGSIYKYLENKGQKQALGYKWKYI